MAEREITDCYSRQQASSATTAAGVASEMAASRKIGQVCRLDYILYFSPSSA